MINRGARTLLLMMTMLWLAAPADAQPAAPAEPAGPLTGTISAGWALTSGNRDTSTLNLGYELVYDPKTRNLIKSDALFLRGETEGELTAERLGFNGRDEYKLTDRAYLFAQLQFLRDRFKEIDYLWSPTGGVGYKLIAAPATTLTVDGGAGVVWEKNPGIDVRTSGALTVGEKLVHKITDTSVFTQYVTALYKTNDFDDALYVFGVSIAASVSTRTQLKFEVIDTYKNALQNPTLVKNDVAVVMALVYKR